MLQFSSVFKTFASRQLVKTGYLTIFNTTSQWKKFLEIPWIETFVYPYGFCFKIDISDDFRELHYITLFLEFTNLNIGFKMKVTDEKQWSFLPNFKSARLNIKMELNLSLVSSTWK